MRIRVNTIVHKYDNAVVPLETTWETFRDVICSGHDVADDKAAARLFNASEYKSPTDLKDDGNLRVYSEEADAFCARRLADNVVAVTMLILDYDGEMLLEEARERFKDYEYVAYTSFSHQLQPGEDRFRIVFPLASPIPAEGRYSPFDSLIRGSVWHELESALKAFAGPCDPVSFRCNQFYYLPLVSEAKKPSAKVWVNAGKILDWTTWERVVPPAYTEKTDESMSSGRYAADTLDPDQMLHVHGGYIRVRDVVGRVEGVWCPFHEDRNGTEFAKRVPSGVFLYCRKCQTTYWMASAFTPPLDEPLITLDAAGRFNGYVDASDRKHVSEQLRAIGKDIINDRLDGSAYSRPSHLVYLPEGSGKSRLAFDLAVDGHKVFFACKSLDQVFEKYQWFKSQAKDQADCKTRQNEIKDAVRPDGEQSPPVEPISIHLFLSKGAKARRRFGVDVVREAPSGPFDAGNIDDEATISAFIAANSNLSESFIRLSWQFFGSDKLDFDADDYREESGSGRYSSANIIVTTFEQVRLLRVRKQSLPPDWNVWFDDPDVSDFSDLEPYQAAEWGDLSDKQKRDKGIIQLEKTGREYFKRDSALSLGASVSRLRCVYTTTEQVTMRAAESLLKRRGEDVRVHDKMEGVVGGKITLLGTRYVYSSLDGIIPLMIRRLEKEGYDARLIADGLGQSLNHSNSKGKNDLTDQTLVVELSSPHPSKVRTICDAMKVSFTVDGKGIARDLVLDQLHQALGRNSGYRYSGFECVALIPANLHSVVLHKVRYAFDQKNSVIIDRTAGMGRKDRRTQDGASELVIATEDFLNNIDQYIQDKRKVIPDIKHVLGGIDDGADSIAYAARLLQAFTTLSEIRFDREPTEADTAKRFYSEYRSAADAVVEQFAGEAAKDRVWAAYRRRMAPKTDGTELDGAAPGTHG